MMHVSYYCSKYITRMWYACNNFYLYPFYLFSFFNINISYIIKNVSYIYFIDFFINNH